MTGNDHIRIRNAVFYAYHGVAEGERKLGGTFEVDADLTGDYSAAAASDDLRRAVNYETVYNLIQDTVRGKKYRLLESLGSAIAEEILRSHRQVSAVTVRVRKTHPPVRGVVESAEAEITRDRKRPGPPGYRAVRSAGMRTRKR